MKMFSQKVLCLIALGLCTFGVVNIESLCLQCSTTTYAACLNETAFAVCYDGITQSKNIGFCPSGQVCTDVQGICQPRSLVKPTCGSCSSCQSGFACITKTKFEYCIGNQLSGIVANCPVGEYCSFKNKIMNQNICIKSCLGEPSCYVDDEEPTPAPEINYKIVCEGTLTPGFYFNYVDLTCHSYVYCEDVNGSMQSILYTCANNYYYSEGEKKCVATKPSSCA